MEAVLDKPIEDMSIEELEAINALDSEEGEAAQAEPDEETTEEVVSEIESETEEPEETVDDKDKIITSMKKEMEGVQKMLARVGTELGELRKAKSQKEEEDIDPYDDADAFIEKKLADRERVASESKQALDNKKSFVTKRIPDFDSMVDNMTSELGDLIGDEPDAEMYKENFKKNPFLVDELTLLFAGRAAEYKKELDKIRGNKQKSNQDKGSLIDKMNKLGKTKATVNGSGSNGSTNGSGLAQLTNRQIEDMTLEELQNYNKQLQGN